MELRPQAPVSCLPATQKSDISGRQESLSLEEAEGRSPLSPITASKLSNGFGRSSVHRHSPASLCLSGLVTGSPRLRQFDAKTCLSTPFLLVPQESALVKDTWFMCGLTLENVVGPENDSPVPMNCVHCMYKCACVTTYVCACAHRQEAFLCVSGVQSSGWGSWSILSLCTHKM